MIKVGRLIGVLMGLSIILGGCSAVNNGFLSQRDTIYGTWGFQDETLGMLKLKFIRGGNFEVDANADGKKDIWGKFMLLNDRIQFVDDEPRITTLCYESGFHTFTIDDGILKFSEFAEQCKPRKFILKQSFKRYP